MQIIDYIYFPTRGLGSPPRPWWNPRLLTAVASAAIIFVLSGCTLFELKKDIAEFSDTYGLSGRILSQTPKTIPNVVVLYRQQEGENAVYQYSVADERGYYTFLVPPGSYYISAFADVNWNLTYDNGETYGYYGSPDSVVVRHEEMTAAGKKATTDLDFELTENSGYKTGFPREADEGKFARPWAKLGVVADLDDSLFSPQYGTMGFWQPLAFIKEVGFGLYFLEPYDPDKVPVLFVHGATGTPSGWKNIVEHLDRTRFQPWFYYYPSGLRLDPVAKVLAGFIKNLQQKYKFEELCVVAQSMGGLVARDFILKSSDDGKNDYLHTFISVSTPWGGINTAAFGVQQSPAVIPSWRDVAPDSEFLLQLYGSSLPPQVRFYLLFGVRGKGHLLMGNNDGTVEIASQIDLRAQHEAARIFGFDEDHGSILESETVISLILNLLDGKSGF